MSVPAGAGRGFGAQVVFLAAARLSTVAAFFGVSVVGARLLSPAELGSAGVGQTIGMVAGLIGNAGINLATIYFLQQRDAERPSMVRRLVAIAIGACSVAVLLVLVSAPLTFGLILDQTAWPLIAAAAAMGATMIAFEFAGALLLGLDRSGRFTLLELIRGWGSLIAVGLLLLGPWRSDAGLVMGMALGYAAAAVMGLAWTTRAGMSLAPQVDLGFSRAVLGFGLRGQIGNVFQFLGVRLDLLLVPSLLDLRAAGIYFIAVRVSDVVGQGATAVASLVFPRVAALTDQRSTDLTERATRLTLIAVAVSALVLGLAGETVLRIAFGPEYATGATVLSVLLVAVVPLSAGRILAADLKGRGRPELVSLAALGAVAATIAFDLVLIPILGLVGAGIASVLTYSVSTIVLLVAYRAVTGGRLAALLPRLADLADAATTLRSMARARRDAA